MNMKSIVAEKAGLAYEPIAILWSNEKPEGALQLKPGARSCIMLFIAQVITKGKTAVFDRETYGCPGARAGLGFGNGYYDAFGGGGLDFMSAFFVKGKASSKDPEAYCSVIQHIPEREQAKFIYGERLHHDPEKARRYMIQDLPVTDIEEKYVVVTPLSQVKPEERPVVVVFYADPVQVSGLVTLVSAIREGTDAIRVPPMAACQHIGAFTYDEAKKEHPRAVLGNTDLAARVTVGKGIPQDLFSFSVPYSLFEEMETEAADCVFDGPIWKDLTENQN